MPAERTFRRTLTEAEALAGVQPPRLTHEEWQAMWDASVHAEGDAKSRTLQHLIRLFPPALNSSNAQHTDNR